MAQLLKDLGEPSEFWEYFEQLSKIPHCSGNEGKMREFIKNEAEKLGCKTQVDHIGNLFVKSAKKNTENDQSKVVLQCHMDMVCEKNEGITHDFSKDPLQLQLIEIKGEKWLTAKGTTLGADNRVGIAYLLTLMKKLYSKELQFDPLLIDMLFTVDEEVGLVGVFNIDKKLVEGNYLINLDSEEDDRFTIGCAGGINTIGEIKFKYISVKKYIKNAVPIKLSVSGLLGGHSGVDIHRDRANSIKIMSKVLWKVNNEYSICIHSINGGNRANAIPREAQAIVFVENNKVSELRTFIDQIIREIKLGIAKIEPNMVIKVDLLQDFENKFVFSEMLKNKLLHMLYVMPYGPISMHPKIPNLVYTSTNLASIKTHNEVISITTSQRSLHEISKKVIYEKIEALFKLTDLDIHISHNGNYPGWDPDFQAELLKKAKKTYKNLFKKDAIIQAIHAGLECGILKQHFPEIDMISLGPTVEGAHSPEERLKIQSVEKIWKFLIKLLNNLV
ncbi:MAG: beta-Ala-His dipeptidase [Promethearchaeota archaeon]